MEDQSRGIDNAVSHQNNSRYSLRTSLVNLANILRQNHSSVLDSSPTSKKKKRTNSSSETTTDANNNNEKQIVSTESFRKDKLSRNTIINIVLVEARGIPASPDDGTSHGVFAKFRSGAHTFKSKSVCHTKQPQWRERFKLNLYHDQLLHISLWDKGKQKTFMGSSVLDLSSKDRERTHDIWQELDGGYGSVHLSVTIYNTSKSADTFSCQQLEEDTRSKYLFYNLPAEIDVVGQLQVNVIGAKGLSGKPNASCILELDNERIQTHKVHSDEPVWNKSYLFNVYDVTSVLEIKLCDNSIFNDFAGRVSIPLLKIENGVSRWYALKDSSKRKGAKGNCPRINLEMTLVWNPVVASLKLFRPKEVKYIAKVKPKFDVPLVYKNVKFIRDTFDFLFKINESFKRLFEWEDAEFTKVAIVLWLVFWYYFRPWMTPMFIALLFPIIWYLDERHSPDTNNRDSVDSNDDSQNEETITDKVKGLPEMTFTITDGIEYLVSVAERLYNLAAFKVPFLSYLAMVLLVGASAALYLIPFNYLMMVFGLYKFTRKFLDPERVLNNDLLDFISRIPDNRILRDWKELSVPEPRHHRTLRSTLSSSSTASLD